MSKTINLGRVKGDDATINGVNTLTVTTGAGLVDSQSGNTYTIAIDADTTPTSGSTKPVTSGGVKAALDDVSASIPSKVSELTNDSNFITNAVNNLTNYYKKSETYTKAEVNSAIAAISTLNIEIVETLPSSDISTSTIYLKAKTKSETNNVYDEYIYVNNAWELIGDTTIDLSNYQTKSLVNSITVDGSTVSTVENALTAINTLAAANKTTLATKQNTTLSKSMNIDGSTVSTVEAALNALNEKEAGINVTGSTVQFLGWNDNGEAVAKDFTDVLDYNPLTSIAITTAPSTTTYYAGSTFDSTGMVITATYRDKTTAVVTGYTVTPSTLAYGTTSVTITYTEDKVTKTATQNVTVNRRSVTVPSQSGSVRADKDGATSKSPLWSDYDQTYMSIVTASSTTSAATVGTYNVVFRLKDTLLYQWTDGSITDKTVTWTLLPAYSLYGFEINQRESDPASRITYIADNASFTSAKLTADNTFSYGDWEDAWFIKDIKVVLMAYDGTITKELNKNNYAQDVDGNSVTITSSAAGNVMVGIPKVYIKVDTSGTNPKVYFSDIQIDSSYHCFAHTDVNGKEIDYTYMAAYEGYSDGTRMRSVSGVYPTGSQTYDTQVSQATANNTQGGVSDVWDIGTFGDRELITFLLMLIGKSTDTQTVFGYGNDNGYSSKSSGSDSNGVVKTGTLNDKGLFAGYTSVHNLAVKVFGIENFWGNVWKRVQGLINNYGTYKVKLCRSSIDGTTSTAYSAAGSGYLSAGSCPSNAYITLMNFNTLGFMLPTASSYTPSSSTYYCDYAYYNNSKVYVALFGGGSCDGLKVGAFALALDLTASSSTWCYGASLSASSRKYKKEWGC